MPVRSGGGNVRPARQFAAIFEGKIKQGGQHHGGELNDTLSTQSNTCRWADYRGHTGALPDRGRHSRRAGRRDDGPHGPPLDVVLGWSMAINMGKGKSWPGLGSTIAGSEEKR